MKNRTDEQIVKLCLNGENKAFDLLVKRYHKPMYRTALNMLKDPALAKDVTQRGFIKAWESLDSFNTDYRFFSWLYKIVINETLNTIRSQKDFSNNIDELSEPSTPHQKTVKKEERQLVRDAINSLKPEYKIVIHLRHFEELSYKEMAEILEIEEKTVKSRLYSARLKLRERIIEAE